MITFHFSHISILTYSAANNESGSILSCFTKWLNGSRPSNAKLRDSDDTNGAAIVFDDFFLFRYLVSVIYQ